MKALHAAGMLGQDERTERYHLGAIAVAMGRRGEERLGLDRLLPELEALAGLTGESVNLGTRIGAEVLIVLHAASPQPLRFEQTVGARVPVHASAMGKAMLAFADDPAAEVAALGDLSRFTGTTLTTPERLLEDLAVTRRRGWSLNDGERDPGVRTIGAPLIGAEGRPWAAVALQGPAIRLTDDRVESLTGQLLTSAAVMARGHL